MPWKWCAVRIAKAILATDAQITVYGADGCADTWIRTDSALMEKGERENE